MTVEAVLAHRGCSHRNGPRFSAWQVQHCSLTEVARIILSVFEPCGLWQSAQSSLPSRIGWCERFQVSARTSRWQLKHCSCTLTD